MAIRPVSMQTYVEACIDNFNKRALEVAAEERSYDDAYHDKIAFQESVVRDGSKRDAGISRRSSFAQCVKSYFLTDILSSIVESCITTELSNNYPKARMMSRSLVSSYIDEVGPDEIMRKMKRGGPLMYESFNLVNEFYRRVMKENADKTPADLALPENTRDDFYNKIDIDNIDSVSEQIRQRVSDSMRDWIDQNASEKEKIKETLDTTNKQISKHAGCKEMQESYAAMGKRHISLIRNKERSLFYNMVESMCKNVIHNQSLHTQFMTEGKLNMDEIVNRCEVAYTFMEAFASLRIADRDNLAVSVLKDLSSFS